MNFLELHSLMLHDKFQIHRPSVFGEEDFLSILLCIALAAIVVM